MCTICRLWSFVISAAAALMLIGGAALAQGNAASVCENPSFKVATGSPFGLSPKPGVEGEPKALVAGNFFKKSGADAGCGCDLAIALASDAGGFVALLRGNDDGTFAQNFVAALPPGETPVAIVKARFKIEGSAKLDSFAVATLKPAAIGDPGRVRIFTPDENGSYSEAPDSWTVDKLPVAMTTGDFDGNQRIDVAVANKARNKLTILFGDGAGLFSRTSTVDLNREIPNSLAAGRFSGAGGRDDIAVGTLTPDPADPAAGRAAVVIVRHDASGAFAASPAIILGEKNSFGPSVAAANLTLPAGAGERPWRDLAIAFVDRDGAGNPIARVKVLLGQDSGGFTARQTHDLGAAITRSATVADLDDDGVIDLIVSTYGETASEPDGTIRFFQGRTGGSAGFHTNPSWFSIPATTGIRPRSLAAGRFGPKVQGQSGARANMGLAVANALNLKSIAVLLGNGRGAFVEPTVVTTSLPKTSRVFVTGDFHSPSGAGPMQDLAYVIDGGAGRNVLSILISNGAGGFAKPDNPAAIIVGDGPHIAVSGKFDNSPPTDIAIIDASLDPVTGAPFVKMLMGRGEGRFDESKFQLEPGERPVAMTAGRFSGQTAGSPLDIAVVSGNGKLTLLVNDTQGRFPRPQRRFTTLPFAPAAIAAIDNPRDSNRHHLVVRDANAKRFLLLLNLGPVDPGEGQFGSGGFFGETGEAPDLLVGEIPRNNSSNPPDHVVTFDKDMTIKAFKANEFDAFDEARVTDPPSGNFSPRPPYTIADFGDGKPGLAAVAVNGESLGIVQMKGDGVGGFRFTNIHMEPEVVKGDALDTQEKTGFETRDSLPTFGVTIQRTIIASIAGQFLSSLHGNNKPDVAFITQVTRTSLTSGACPNDQRPTPPPMRPRICRDRIFLDFDECRGLGLPRGCSIVDTSQPCCMCPGRDQCPNTCDPSLVRPFFPFCTTTQVFAPVITVFANTCGR